MKDIEEITKESSNEEKEKAVVQDDEIGRNSNNKKSTQKKESGPTIKTKPVVLPSSESSKDKSASQTPEQYEALEEVMQQGMAFLSGMMKMATGSDLNVNDKSISVNKKTGEVVLKFKLPSV